jgi:hypothetical protein
MFWSIKKIRQTKSEDWTDSPILRIRILNCEYCKSPGLEGGGGIGERMTKVVWGTVKGPRSHMPSARIGAFVETTSRR